MLEAHTRTACAYAAAAILEAMDIASVWRYALQL